MMSHVSASQGWASEASRATSAGRGGGVKVGACHDGLCDPLAMDTAETGCGVGDYGPAH